MVVRPTSIDFGDVESGNRPPPRLIRLTNAGGSHLDVAVTTSATWLETELRDDELLVSTALPAGEYSGTVRVDTEGGRVDISVELHVHPAPPPPTIPREVPAPGPPEGPHADDNAASW
jgi:hypothetical protein